MTVTVAALYHFTRLNDPAALCTLLAGQCEALRIRGSLLLAHEGVNGTIAGSEAAIEQILTHIRALPGCAALEVKFSTAAKMPFGRMKVRLKREIVTMGQPDVDPRASVGTYVAPADWNDLIGREDVVLIDTRNAYEVAIGSFERAIDPQTDQFSDFPDWWAANAERLKGRPVAMFCTGGIRCEKASNYLLGQGVAQVFHLRGGILKYLEDVPAEQSRWHGECFVFDERVSVRHGLAEGDMALCHGCRRPIEAADRAHPSFEEGVSCRHCIGETSARRREGFRERQKQITLARARGERHLGPKQ